MQSKHIPFLLAGLVLGLLAGFLVANFATGNSDDSVARIESAVESLQGSVDGLQSSVANLEGAIGTMQEQQLALQIPRQSRTVNEAAVVSDFYLITLAQAQSWIEEQTDASDEAEASDAAEATEEAVVVDLSERFQSVADAITTVETLDGSLDDAEGPAALVLSEIYALLSESIEATDDAPIVPCFGLEIDQYTANSFLYVYIQVPSAQEVDETVIPATWELLNGPREEGMLWAVECYAPEKR